MRILLINPNTTPAVTDLVADHVRGLVGGAAEIVAVTGRFGARYIASRAASAIAGHAALDALAEHVAGADAVYLACFGDPGLAALREVSPVPVVGMAEAACRAACAEGRRFAIVTGGALWGPMLTEFVATLGLADRLSGVRTVAPTGGEIAADPEAALGLLAAACTACAEADGAEAVILGGAALAGLAARIQPRVPVPVLCSVEAGTRAVLAAAGARAGGGGPRGTAPTLASVGLSPALAALLAGT
ncbi:aspartate/glutamate racemase family protein [Methylobacterium sp. J-068]|uniref:aspartate/glutamate racemase family protein n=1 Tax=Methylobacterium sp. J-068 TaxID=2836649 RepID=UPI001FBA0E11|nr:aspartate/glutamate racemase family protein [Methylobacterium sp. J-068]MCJ2035045.1 aspartate/glutamate racemase family protein [Methylobacterium sp. J-068]